SACRLVPPWSHERRRARPRPHHERLGVARGHEPVRVRRHSSAHHPHRDRHLRLPGCDDVMATNRELTAEALALGKQLGVEVDVQRKNNAQLTELVEGLRARVFALEEPTAEEVKPAPASEAPVTSAPVVEEASPSPPVASQKSPVYRI